MTHKALRFTMLVSALILGVTLLRQFDADTRTFKNNALAVVYLLGFIISLVLLLRGNKKAV